MEEWKNRLMECSENISKLALSVNAAMTSFVQSDSFRKLANFFGNLPDDIQKTELFRYINNLKDKEITSDDIEWMQKVLGIKEYNASVDELRKKKIKSELDEYVLSIIESDLMSSKEKIIVILAHFESLVYQTMGYERQSWDQVKRIISEETRNSHEMKAKDSAKILLAGIIFIVFSNTDNYKNEINKRIPFRNLILHRGVLDYSGEEIKVAYELLVYFVAELSVLEKVCIDL